MESNRPENRHAPDSPALDGADQPQQPLTAPQWCRRFAWRFWKEWVKPLVPVLLVLFAFRSSVADWHDVPTGSMKPTILEGDRIFVDKIAYDLKIPFTGWQVAEWGDPKPGEVVVLFSPRDGTRLVKRVIAGPGDVVAMQNNQLFINGTPLAHHVLDRHISDDAAETTKLDDGTREHLNNRPRTEQEKRARLQQLLANYVEFRETLGGEEHTIRITPQINARRSFAPVQVPEGYFWVMGDNRDLSADSRFFGLVPRGLINGKVRGVAFSLDRDHYFAPRWSRFFDGL